MKGFWQIFDNDPQPPYAWWRSNSFCVNLFFKVQRIMLRGIWPWSTISELRDWKESQLKIERGWDEQLVGRELEIGWGEAIRPQILTKIHGIKSRMYLAEQQVVMRESLHEQEWLRNAALFAGVDFNHIDRQVEDGIRLYNAERMCAKECYRLGMGYREFPEFLRIYKGKSCR